MDQFVTLFPAGGLPWGLPVTPQGCLCWCVGGGGRERGMVFWALLREVQAFTSKALILFFAELAQPLPVFGSA